MTTTTEKLEGPALSEVEARAWSAYQRVREVVAGMRATPAAGLAAPSAYWSEELGLIDYMADASPLIVRKLRHHAFWITGLRAYDYRIQDDERRELFETRLRALVGLGGADLLVPEAEALGGFGYRIDGQLYNLDTLKFFEVLVGLRRAGILDPLMGRLKPAPTYVGSGFSRSNPVIVEVGGGWGGLAYQLKTLVPHATCVIVDLPELFLFSAVYLQTLFPQARVAFLPQDDAAGADFVFVPNTHAAVIETLRPSLLLNVASFQEMTTAQVESYACAAARGGCPHVYSLNRERSRYNRELSGVSEVLARFYDLREVTLLDTDYTKAMKKPSKSKKKDAEARSAEAPASATTDLSYRHLAGWSRA